MAALAHFTVLCSTAELPPDEWNRDGTAMDLEQQTSFSFFAKSKPANP